MSDDETTAAFIALLKSKPNVVTRALQRVVSEALAPDTKTTNEAALEALVQTIWDAQSKVAKVTCMHAVNHDIGTCAKCAKYRDRDDPAFKGGDDNGRGGDHVLYSARRDCKHLIHARMSGIGCTKCPGWFCL